ncbi:MAG TPA: MBL fold metallo-hydrolase, partial [Pseudonocardia sp.]|nr:MBL fold metallo-hydrolase [Pseudonocardia sp.]
MIDAFLTPVSFLDAAVRRGVSTDESVVASALDRVRADRVEAIFISHSHFDHAFDVASIALRTGATVFGSESTLNIARGGGVPEAQLRLFDLVTSVQVGDLAVRTLASRHSPNPVGGEGVTIATPLLQPAPHWNDFFCPVHPPLPLQR